MSKYSNHLKLEVVEYYLNSGCGYHVAANHFNIKSYSVVERWVKKYKEHGAKGLLRNFNQYDGNFKLNVIKYMHENHLSSNQTAMHFNLSNDWVVSKWERIYYEEGYEALFEERRGRGKKMNGKPKKKLSKETEKDLIEEVQQLRMENEYLKKLNALVQERIKRENGKK